MMECTFSVNRNYVHLSKLLFAFIPFFPHRERGGAYCELSSIFPLFSRCWLFRFGISFHLVTRPCIIEKTAVHRWSEHLPQIIQTNSKSTHLCCSHHLVNNNDTWKWCTKWFRMYASDGWNLFYIMHHSSISVAWKMDHTSGKRTCLVSL